MLGAAMISTLAPIYRPLMDAPTLRSSRCVVCGAPAHDQHHIVWRSWGELYDEDGNPRPKPTVSLCGFGNTSGCHGLAHQRMLHFRYYGALECLITDQPTNYLDALEMGGWRAVHAEAW